MLRGEARSSSCLAAEWQQSSNVLWALAGLDSDERHARALQIQMGPAGIIHLFFWTNYLWLLMQRHGDQSCAKLTFQQEEQDKKQQALVKQALSLHQDAHTVQPTQGQGAATFVPHPLVWRDFCPICPDAGALWWDLGPRPPTGAGIGIGCWVGLFLLPQLSGSDTKLK